MTEWISAMGILNLLWVVFSLPIITIIPVTDALFEVLGKEQLDGSLAKSFVVSFKKNFRKSFKLGIPLFAVFFILAIDVFFLLNTSSTEMAIVVIKAVIFSVVLFVFISLLMGYTLSKQKNIDEYRVFYYGFMYTIKNPIISFLILDGLFFLVVLIKNWPILSIFFMMSVIAWMFNKGVSIIIQRELEIQKEEKFL